MVVKTAVKTGTTTMMESLTVAINARREMLGGRLLPQPTMTAMVAAMLAKTQMMIMTAFSMFPTCVRRVCSAGPRHPQQTTMGMAVKIHLRIPMTITMVTLTAATIVHLIQIQIRATTISTPLGMSATLMMTTMALTTLMMLAHKATNLGLLPPQTITTPMDVMIR